MPNKKFIKPYKKDSPEYKKKLNELKYQGIRLVVSQPFNEFKKGDIINKYKNIKKILSSQHAQHVLKIKS